MNSIQTIIQKLIGAACLLTVPFVILTSYIEVIPRTGGNVALMIFGAILTAFIAGGCLGRWTYIPLMSFGTYRATPDVTNSWMWFLIALIANLMHVNFIS